MLALKLPPTPSSATRSWSPGADADAPGFPQRVVLWLLPVTAAIGGTVFSVDVGPIPMYPFKVLVPLVFIAAVVSASRSFRPRAETWILLALVGWAALGSLWADDPGSALQVASIFAFAAMLFTTLHIWGPGAVDDLVTGWRIALVVAAAVALAEITVGFQIPTAFVVERAGDTGGTVLSVFNNPNDFGAFLAIAIPISLFPTRGRIPLWAAGLALASTGLLILSASRFALVGLVVAVAIVAIRQRRRWWMLPTGWILSGAAVAGFVVLVALGASLAMKLLVLTQPGALGDTSAGVRVALIANGIWAAVVTSGLGLGGGGYPAMIESVAVPVTVRPGVVNPHNMWIEFLAELGVVGLTLFVLLIVVVWRRWTRRSGAPEPAATVIWASLGAYVVAVCTSSSYLSSPVSWMFLATVSLMAMPPVAPERSPLQSPSGGQVDGLLPLPHFDQCQLQPRRSTRRPNE